LPFIILGAVYFITFAFASVQRMANTKDEFIVEDASTQYFQIAQTKTLPHLPHLLDSHNDLDEIQTLKVPHVISFCLTKPERENLFEHHSDPHYGIIPIRPPPFRS
jgi:hypothetical protein